MKDKHQTIERLTLICSFCQAHFVRSQKKQDKNPILFCAYCGKPLPQNSYNELSSINHTDQTNEPTKTGQSPQMLGQYRIQETIGRGGMGEVYLAYDTIGGRQLAVKKIRNDLASYPHLHRRFLREAQITGQLIHPSIIPIYSIHTEEGLLYYAMPYIEGTTLKQILRDAVREEKKRHNDFSSPKYSIPKLIRHFLQVCQAIAYAHSREILHRDIKPENIIVGKYGQIVILDWGLAKFLNLNVIEKEEKKANEEEADALQITRIGKIVGTITYMAPERALGKPATIQTDIYSLGVILYQILTLQYPFKRSSLSSLKKNWQKENIPIPELLAPYRDVPQVLSEMVKKCLTKDPNERFKSVDEMIHSLENYLEGRSEWVCAKNLNIFNKDDWQFQENIMIAEHTAITRMTGAAEWVQLMISKDAFPDNVRIETEIHLSENSIGIGFLLAIPEELERKNLIDGYCLWIAAEGEEQKRTKILRSSMSVLEAPEIYLTKNTWHKITIEKIGNHLYFYLNNELEFSYLSYLPIIGSHIGILTRDINFTLKDVSIFVGSENIQVSCLSIPDAFLASKNFTRAFSEYRRISALFPGQAEGREALFRAGITLLEQGKVSNHTEQQLLYEAAHEEFTKLRSTPSAPLEYLGKAYIYQTLGDIEEEVKCFELAIRRYKYHPQLPVLEEQISCRMHESSSNNRAAAYHFISLVARFLPKLAKNAASKRLFNNLLYYWEIPPCIVHRIEEDIDDDTVRQSFCIILGFWLAKPYIIEEALTALLQIPILPIVQISDALFALIELGCTKKAEEKLHLIQKTLSQQEQKRYFNTFIWLDLYFKLLHNKTSAEEISSYFTSLEPTLEYIRALYMFMRYAIDIQDTELVEKLSTFKEAMNSYYKEEIDALLIEHYVRKKEFQKVINTLSVHSKSNIQQETSRLYFASGICLSIEKGPKAALDLFSRTLENPYPRSWLLCAYALSGNMQPLDIWLERSFMWERRNLYRDLFLFWQASKEEDKALSWIELAQKEYIPNE